MKILRLDLRAFGGFSHKEFSFDPKKKIHILYGENETGKSSFTRALKALLFGIEKKSKDTYLHPQENLFLEGLIENEAGKITQILRDNSSSRKQNQMLQKLFPKLTKESFSNLFCLNQDTIRIGSKDLLENIRHFDVSLFSSLQGSSGIVKLLKSIEADIDELYKNRGVKPYINQKIQFVSGLLEEQKSIQLSYQKWKELIEKKKELIKEEKKTREEYENLFEYEQDLKTLSHIYDLIPNYLEYQKFLDEFDAKGVLKKNDLALYKELRDSLEQLKSSVSEAQKDIQKLKLEINHNSYNLKLVDLKPQLEILLKESKNYELWIARKNKNNSELLELKAKFKHTNLALQKKINTSISFESWGKIRVEALNIIEELKKLTCLKSDKIKQITLQKEKLDLLEKEYKKIPSASNLKILEKETETFDKGILIENELAEVKQKLDFAITQLKSHRLKANEITVKKLQAAKFIEVSEVELAHLETKYLDCLQRFKLSKEKHLNLNEMKGSVSSIDLESYFKLKKERQTLKSNLIKPWTSTNYAEKYELFLKYQCLIDKEDLKEAFLFSNVDKLATHKKLTLDIEDSEKELKSNQESLSSLIDSLSKIVLPFENLLSKVDFYDFDSIKELITFIKKMLQIKVCIETYDQLKVKHDGLIKQLLKHTSSKSSIVDMKKEFLKSLAEKKQLTIKKEKIDLQIKFTYKNINEFESDLKVLNTSFNSLQKAWEKIAEKNQIKASFDSEEILGVISHLDTFFELSKLITLKNDLVKNDLKLTQEFELNLEKIRLKSGFTDLDKKNLLLYNKKAQEELIKKNKNDQLTFLLNNKLKDVDVLIDKELKEEKKLEQLTKKIGSKTPFELEKQAEKSASYYSKVEEHQKLHSILDLKTKPKSLNYFMGLQKDFSSVESLQTRRESLELELKEALNANEIAQKEIGAMDFQENAANSFAKKYKLDEKLQTETYELNEKIEEYIIAKSSAKIIRRFIWDFQQKNQDYVLKKASSLFEEITGGKYINIQLNMLDQKESFLICESNLSQKVTVDLLSEGTRDQLFLSLKLAMSQLYDKRNPLPLVLDDVLVNFDDERSLNTLKLLETLSQSCQIIFLTHHQHILKLIEKSFKKDLFQLIELNSYAAI